jgi:hypothetical protein
MVGSYDPNGCGPAVTCGDALPCRPAGRFGDRGRETCREPMRPAFAEDVKSESLPNDIGIE